MSVVENIRPVEDYRVIRKRLWNPPNAVHDPERELPKNRIAVKPVASPAAKAPSPPPLLSIPPTSNVIDLELMRLVRQATDIEALLRNGLTRDPTRQNPSVKDIIRIVAGFYEVSTRDIMSDIRMAELVRARHVAMYVAKNITGLPTTELGRLFGGRDHTSVIHAVRNIEAAIQQQDERMRDEVQLINMRVIEFMDSGEFPKNDGAARLIAARHVKLLVRDAEFLGLLEANGGSIRYADMPLIYRTRRDTVRRRCSLAGYVAFREGEWTLEPLGRTALRSHRQRKMASKGKTQ